jgi:PPOX class F420-dependent enzyme/OxyR family protein
MFSEKDRNYLKRQRLARIATVSKQSQPDVAPVGYEFDGEYFYVGGRSMTTTFKYKNVKANPKVAIVVDDLESVDPWRPRGIRVHGTGELVHRRVTPARASISGYDRRRCAVGASTSLDERRRADESQNETNSRLRPCL